MTALLPILRGRFIASEIPLMCHLGEGHWLAGENDKARQTLEEALKITERCGARYYSAFAQRLLGEIELRIKPAQAVAHFEKSIAIFQEIKAENALALTFAGYGRCYKLKGQISQAREYLTKGLEIFERLGTLIEPDKVRKELAGLREV